MMPLKDWPCMAARKGAGTDTRPLRSTLLINVDRNNAIHSPYENHFSHLHARKTAAVRDPLAARSHACRNWDDLGYHGILWASMEIHWKFLEFQGLAGTVIESRRHSLESFGINVFPDAGPALPAIRAAVCSIVVLFWETPGPLGAGVGHGISWAKSRRNPYGPRPSNKPENKYGRFTGKKRARRPVSRVLSPEA